MPSLMHPTSSISRSRLGRSHNRSVMPSRPRSLQLDKTSGIPMGSPSQSPLILIGRTAESLDEEIDSRGNHEAAFTSVLDVFKIGVGPSSSHTMGPMLAASRFLDLVASKGLVDRTRRFQARLHGSLAYTGKGHATDRATCLGLAGFLPQSYDFKEAEEALKIMHESKVIRPVKLQEKSFRFDPATDLVFDFGLPLPQHPNGLTFTALDENEQVLIQETYFSIGGLSRILRRGLCIHQQMMTAFLPTAPRVPSFLSHLQQLRR